MYAILKLIGIVILTIGIQLFTAEVAFSQKEKTKKETIKKLDTLEIKTSAVCGMCKQRIENDLNFLKGVKSSNLDLETKIVTVSFNPEKVDGEKIKQTISKTGYDADDVKANQKSYDKLNPCCQKGGHD